MLRTAAKHRKKCLTARHRAAAVPHGIKAGAYDSCAPLPVPDGPAENIFESFLPVPDGPAKNFFEGFYPSRMDLALDVKTLTVR